ncbi:MAG: uridine kinase [Chloroflexota bacterium]|nr:uridine kinase [Chloroflexota bacterium]
MAPVVVGIAGGSGSGKTTLVNAILAGLGSASVARLEQDSYYRDRPDLPLYERSQINYDHPDSLDNELLAGHIRSLLRGLLVHKPRYDFARHERRPDCEEVLPARILLVDGILVLENAELRSLMDLKLYVDTDSDIRFIRRLLRDLNERGRTLESVVHQYLETVRPMHLQFVEPSKRYADVIIPEGGLNEVATALVVTRLRALLG